MGVTQFAALQGVDRSVKRYLFWAFGLGLVVQLVLAWFSVGFYHYDEHFQILEFAGYKTGRIPADALPWEFHDHIRSAFQPFIAWVILKTLDVFSIDNPFLAANILRLISGILGWLGTVIITLAFLPRFSKAWAKKWFILISAGISGLLFMHARFSSEGWSGTFAFTAIALIFMSLQHKINERNSGKKSISTAMLLFSGFLLGLSYLCRVQSLFLFPGLVLWLYFIAGLRIPSLLVLCAGIGMAVVAGFVLDRWFYGQWVNTAWQYIEKNIIEGKAAGFGTEPWWWYFRQLAFSGLWPVQLAMTIIVLFAFITHRSNILVWTTIPFLLAHIIVSHKEFRFLFPLIDALPFFLILGIYTFTGMWQPQARLWPYAGTIAGVLFMIFNIVAISEMCTHPPQAFLYPLEYLYKKKPAEADVLINDWYLATLMNGSIQLNYYRQPGTKFVYFQNPDTINTYVAASKKPVYVMLSSKGFGVSPQLSHVHVRLQPVYWQLPEGCRHMKPGTWTERTSFWRTYAVKRDTP